MILVPLLGMWLSSSLAAYYNRSVTWCIVLGLLFFPLLPLAWDRFYLWRDAKKNTDPKRFLTTVDRLVLRTLAINISLVVALVTVAPEAAFRAISTRGDWVFDGHDGPISNGARRYLFLLADTLEGRFQKASEVYGESDQAPDQVPQPVPEANEPDGHWPLPGGIHTAVREMPSSVQGSYQEVAAYLKRRFDDPFERTRAIHDFITLRLTYDDAQLAKYESGDLEGRRSQQAPDVFESGLAVCEGYARLMRAIGEEAGLEVAYIVGNSRSNQSSDTEGVLHAWNAVKIADQWYLIDVTWDDGDEQQDYKTGYLNTPPEIFGISHFPEDPAWQLRETPLTMGEFMRQPDLRPAFAIYGLEMIAPTRSQVTVDGRLDMQIANPQGAYLLASWRRKDQLRTNKNSTDCEVSGGTTVEIRCRFPEDGEYLVVVYANRESHGAFAGVAQQRVNSR